MFINASQAKNFLNDTFQAGVDNFNSSVLEYEKKISYRHLASIYEALFDPQYWNTKPNDLQAYLLSYVASIKYDYAKSLQHLLQGYLSDHYFFIRRGIETAQLIIFLNEMITSERIFKEYSEISISEFKKRYKYTNWFRSKKEHFLKEYRVSMKAYEDACNLGVHVSKERRNLFQKVDFISQSELRITSVFHDCKGDPDSIDLVPVYFLKVHDTFLDIYRSIITEKIFDVVKPKDLINRYSTRFQQNEIMLKEHYKTIDPLENHVSFDK